MSPPDCDHCLRPTFTARIAADLLERRRPINLIGAPGQGRGRLLDDLARIDPDATLWLLADLKAHRYGFPGLIDALWDQAGLPGGRPRSLGRLVDRLEGCGRRVCLLLNHFDAILDNPDVGVGYDVAFLDALNALKGRGIGLLCVTGRGHSRYLMMTKAGERRVSTLVLEEERLRPLALDELRVEVWRCLPGSSADDTDLLADALSRHPLPLAFLAFIRAEISDAGEQAIPVAERLPGWRRAFKGGQGGFSPVHAAGLRNRLVTWARALGLHRIPLPGKSLGRLIDHWLGGKGKGP